MLSSLGQTPSASHFDMSNGLPTCLRNEAPFKLGYRQDNSEVTLVDKDETSFNDIKQALLNSKVDTDHDQGQSSPGMVDPYSLQTIHNILNTESNLSDVDLKSGQRVNAQYLNDFLRGYPQSSDMRASEEEEGAKTLRIMNDEYSMTLDMEFPAVKDFAEFE